MNRNGSGLALWILCGIVSLQSVAFAQSKPPQFEVSTIREIVDNKVGAGGFSSAGTRAEYGGFGVQALVAEAWNLRTDEVEFGTGVDRKKVIPMLTLGRSANIYNIVALAPEGTAPTRDQFRLMLRSLLVNRFKLVTHTEKREKDVYVLRTDGKPQLKPSSGDGPCTGVGGGGRTPQGQKIVVTHCPVERLMNNLFVDRPIYDETGLTGFYDFESTSALPFQTGPEAITPFSAVKELGLKLEAKRIPVDTIVIDHVEGPGEN